MALTVTATRLTFKIVSEWLGLKILLLLQYHAIEQNIKLKVKPKQNLERFCETLAENIR